MKKSLLSFLVSTIILTVIATAATSEFSQNSQAQVLRHVVLIDLNDEATDSVITMMNQDLEELKESITQIRKLEFGTNIQQDSDYSHCMFLTFENVEDLKEYEEHPLHLEFASTYGKYVAKKTEVDYWQ